FSKTTTQVTLTRTAASGSVAGLASVAPGANLVPAAARPVFVTSTFDKVFAQYGDNLLENGNFSDFVEANGTAGGWTSASLDPAGGWRSGGYFILNSNGLAPHPTISQTLSDLLPGITYQVTGQFINVYSGYGNDNAGSFLAQVRAPNGATTQQLGS